MEYPALVYRTPGSQSGNGFTFDSIGVDSIDAHIDAIQNGWFYTVDDAAKKADQSEKVNALRVERAKARDDAEMARMEADEKAKAQRAADEAAVKASVKPSGTISLKK